MGKYIQNIFKNNLIKVFDYVAGIDHVSAVSNGINTGLHAEMCLNN